ncbi:MAG: metal-dependent transcriptional regulator [Clostridiales bacterium]|nr:metal-dependent transcriptional regulator [Clostridiales bacterium]
MILQESGEMYLETILLLSKELQNVRSLDVANKMGFSKPSVSRAVGLLKNEDYIKVDGNGYITLTKKGLATAEKIYERHIVLSDFFGKIGVSEETAAEDACRIEHLISDETFGKLKEFLSKNSL